MRFGGLVWVALLVALALGCIGNTEGGIKQPIDARDLAGSGHMLGDADAPVTIVEFSDYECPFCGTFSRETFPKIKAEYIDTGKARFVYRHAPLGFHEHARGAAEAAECAGQEGLFWQMHETLFNNQGELSAFNYRRWAVELGADATTFSQCMDSRLGAPAVDLDLKEGDAIGVSGVPVFIIGGRVVGGARPYEDFKRAIDGELNG